MKRTYSMFQEYITYVLLVSLFLQSCGELNHPIIPITEEQTASLQPGAQSLIHQDNIQPLVGQALTAQGEHIVTCYQQEKESEENRCQPARKKKYKTEELETKSLSLRELPSAIKLPPTSGQGITIIDNRGYQSHTGYSVSKAGDMNGDGIDDVIIGAEYDKSLPGASYIIYGSKNLPSVINLPPTSEQGITITGQFAASASVSEAGDVNGDGIDDVIIGNPAGNYYTGVSYILYGNKTLPPTIDLSAIGSQGLTITNNNRFENYFTAIGHSVSAAGDVNGDGIDDVIIGAFNANKVAPPDGTGASYIVYGSKTLPSTIDLSAFGKQGAIINGVNTGDSAGFSVSAAGDVNGDDIDDVIIGATHANGGRGVSYIVYGSKTLSSTINLSALRSQGIVINGINTGDLTGYSVNGAGDVNKDGIDDVIIGASRRKLNAGASYIIYGNKKLPSTIDLSTLGTQGIAIYNVGGLTGHSVNKAGDVNKDGIDDVIIGAPSAYSSRGIGYIVYGSKILPSTMNLFDLGNQGVTINGAESGEKAGWSVSVAGDINGDGIDDVIIGAPWSNNQAGTSYVVYGQTTPSSSPSTMHSVSPLASVSVSPSISVTPSVSLTPTPSVSPSASVSVSPSISVTPSVSLTPTPSASPSASVSVSPSISVTPSVSLTPTPSASPSVSVRPRASNSPKPDLSSAIGHNVPWYLPVKWVSVLKGWLNKQQSIDTSLPYVSELLYFKAKCQNLIEQADQVSNDKWYQYSLEDLITDINLTLKHPKDMHNETLLEFKGRLQGIRKDFLETEMVQGPIIYHMLKPVGTNLRSAELLLPGLSALPQVSNLPALN
jgi:hypothetical protein